MKAKKAKPKKRAKAVRKSDERGASSGLRIVDMRARPRGKRRSVDP